MGVVFAQVSSLNASCGDNRQSPPRRRRRRHRRRGRDHRKNVVSPADVLANEAHHIFTNGQWRRARFFNHPEVKLTMSVNASDYQAFRRSCPTVAQTAITAMADTGGQSCLWSMTGFLAAGFTPSDLIPVSIDLVAANKSPIKIAGANILRLHGHSPDSETFSCATMVYVSEAARGFYLSWEAMMDLGIVSPNFPSVGAAADPAVTQQPPSRSTERHGSLNAGGLAQTTYSIDSCSCPPRTVVPVRPLVLPFECTPANNSKMEEWPLHRFASSTFNTCPHRPLPCMTGPPVEIHLEDGVIPRAVHTAAPVPIHWQEQVLSDLKRDEALGVTERIPYGEPVSWCHRMVVTRKHNGTPRRTVDLSPLNKHCKRETFPTESPFHLARIEEYLKALGRQSVMPGTDIIASPSVNLTVTSQPSSLRSDDGDTRGRLKASFPRVMDTTAASMRYYLTLRERSVVWMTQSTKTPTCRRTGGEPLTFSSV